jgi:hypothetical protein
MASGLYITIFFEVSHQFVRNWKGKMIAYEVQKAGRVNSEFLNRKLNTSQIVKNLEKTYPVLKVTKTSKKK